MSITAIIDAGGEITLQLGAEQGLAGTPGPAGGAGATYVASGALSGHQVIAIDAAGEAFSASADALSHAMRVAGVSLGAAAAGGDITVQSAGLIEHAGWAWTPDELVYLGLAGALTQALPGTAAFSMVIGKAVSPTRLLVTLQPPIKLP